MHEGSKGGLIGREAEIELLRGLIRDRTETAGTLVIRGEAGMGKSALLQAATDDARAQSMTVLTTSGVQAEAQIAFAGLHSLLQPLLHELDRLARPRRDAISAAFGMTNAEASAHDPFLIGVATLELLEAAAVVEPLLLVVDDAQWLDTATIEALTFAARRVRSERIALLVATTDGYDVEPDLGDLPELRLNGLDDVAAACLLDERAPLLLPTLRERVLEQALGNPLALEELSASLQTAGAADALSPTTSEWPLSDRLIRAFSVRLSRMPPETLALLLLVSCDERSLLSESLAGAELMGESVPAMLGALAPAIRAGIVRLEGPKVRFRHPLVRSLIYQSADPTTRCAVHAAMCDVVRRDPFRRAWHAALAIVGPDAEVAAELHETARPVFEQGRVREAFGAFERAASLTDDAGARVRFLVAAADAAFELGWPEVGQQLAAASDRCRSDDPGVELALRIRLTLGDRCGDDAGVGDLLRCAGMETDSFSARRMVFRAAVDSLWFDSSERVGGSIVVAADLLDLDTDDPYFLAVTAAVGPPSSRLGVCARLDGVSGLVMESPDDAFALGFAAVAASRDECAARFLSRAVDGFRAQGRIAPLAQALTLRCWSSIAVSRFESAMADAEEGAALASRSGQPGWEAHSLAASALLTALRGDDAGAGALADAADRLSVPRGAVAAIAAASIARAGAALAIGRHAEAVRSLGGVYGGSDGGATFQRLAAIADFTEACVRSGDGSPARAVLRDLARRVPSPLLSSFPEVAYARALLGEECDMERRLRAALETSAPSPFLRARIQLALGSFLRRQRRGVDSREPLESSAAAFEALGVTPWAERARQELRATGLQSNRGVAYRRELTPQERLIAQMAATGLSNRQIGQHLFLSPRTVGAHLYRIFPKLNVASRGELHRALAREGEPVAA